eukprot:5964459-Prorocentrum_lima.AAC.1
MRERAPKFRAAARHFREARPWAHDSASSDPHGVTGKPGRPMDGLEERGRQVVSEAVSYTHLRAHETR